MKLKYDLVEATLNYLNGTRLFEMAHSLQKSKDTIDDLKHHIVEHLCKIFLLGKSHRDYNHWCGEVNGALKKYQFLTFNNKVPSVKQYQDWFYTYGYGVTEDFLRKLYIEDTLRLEYNRTVVIDYKDLYDKVTNVMDGVFSDLADKRKPDINRYL